MSQEELTTTLLQCLLLNHLEWLPLLSTCVGVLPGEWTPIPFSVGDLTA